VICRGYGGKSNHWPQLVTADSSPEEVGDEAVLIANHCQCPVGAGPDRVQAAQLLIRDKQCNIIVSDDGLQHLALIRDIEIVVIDGERRFGNGLCLPAGPLRELPSRLNSVDLVVSNGQAKTKEHVMTLRYNTFEDINGNSASKSPSEFEGTSAEALAGIGNNERFFNTLEALNIAINRHSFPDHYAYQSNDVMFNNDLPVLMTEKDAVKCKRFSLENTWYLKVHAELNESFYQALESMMANIK
jgi:tetraacyldisaccharide 4'-kinase